jgi:D-inositol-3-phosphate glycosyltransferase
VVHSHYWLSGRVAGYFKNVWHVPMVAMFHTLAELKNRVNSSDDESEGATRVAIERLTVATADQVIAATPIDRGHLETYYGADESRIRVVPCGVDLQRFSPGSQEAAREALGIGGERVVLFVGRIQQLKGIELLIRAAANLAQRERRGAVPPFTVLIVGGRSSRDGDDPEAREVRRLRALATELGVQDRLRWVGAVEHEQLPLYYRAADVTVMPSTYESFGLVAVESMACGTPVVAAQVGGLKATIVDGATGFLIPRRDPVAYADRIADLIVDSPLRRRLGEAGRTRAGLFGWEQVAGQLIELYTSLSKGRASQQSESALLAR